MHKRSLIGATVSCLWLAGALAPASAAETGVSLELSALDPAGEACVLSFVSQNNTGHTISRAVYETVLFDQNGQVAHLSLLDFQDLPAARMRVRQFQVPLACTQLTRVLINGASTCEGDGISPTVCTDGLELNSKVATELLG